MVSHSDVVIVGAGPAGSSTAIFLARQGWNVTLLDRADFPRDKPCGEYLTPGAVRILHDEIGVLPVLLAAGARHITHETVVAHNGAAFGGPTHALSCPRVVTDDILRNQAEAEGVTVVENFAARRAFFCDDRVIGIEGDGPAGPTRYHAQITVGADGTHSLIARTLGLTRRIPRLQRIALVGHFTGVTGSYNGAAHDCGVTMHLPSDRTDACCGLGPPSGPEDACNVNIVVPLSEGRSIAGRHSAYFQERLEKSFPEVARQMRGAVAIDPLRSIGCFGHTTTRATHDGAVLVGDAATFIHPFTGEGVFFALRGGQLAATAINAALLAGDVSRRALASYDAARRRELLPRYRLCDWVQRVVHSPALLGLASDRLRRSPALTEALLRTLGDIDAPCSLATVQTLKLALA